MSCFVQDPNVLHANICKQHPLGGNSRWTSSDEGAIQCPASFGWWHHCGAALDQGCVVSMHGAFLNICIIYRIKHVVLLYSIIWLLFCYHFCMIHAWNGKWERFLNMHLAGTDYWTWSTCAYPCANWTWLFCPCPSARHETLTSKAVGCAWTMTYDASHMIVALLRLTASRWPHRRPSVFRQRADRSLCDSIQVQSVHYLNL